MFQPWPQWGPPADQATYPMEGQPAIAPSGPMGWSGFDPRPPWGWNGWGNGPYMPPRGPHMAGPGFGAPPGPIDPMGSAPKVEEPKTAEEAEKYYRNQAMQWQQQQQQQPQQQAPPPQQQFPAWGTQPPPPMGQPWPPNTAWPPGQGQWPTSQGQWPANTPTPGAPWATGTGGWPTAPAWGGYDQQQQQQQQAWPNNTTNNQQQPPYPADWAAQVPTAPVEPQPPQPQQPPIPPPNNTTQQQQQQQAGNPNEILALDDADFNYRVADWEKQFEDWKEKNKNHPDKEAFQKYEKQWQMHREHLFKQREVYRAQRAASLMAAQKPPAAATASLPTQQQTPPQPPPTTDSTTAVTNSVQPIPPTQPPPATEPPPPQPTTPALPNESTPSFPKAAASPFVNAPNSQAAPPPPAATPQPKSEQHTYPESQTTSAAPPTALLPTPTDPSRPPPSHPLLGTPAAVSSTPVPTFTPPDTSKPPPGLLDSNFPQPPPEKKDFPTSYNPSQPPPNVEHHFKPEEAQAKGDEDKRSFPKPLHEYPPPSSESQEDYSKGRHYFEDSNQGAAPADFPRSRGRGTSYRGRGNYRHKNWSYEEEEGGGDEYRRPSPDPGIYNEPYRRPPYNNPARPPPPSPQDEPYQRHPYPPEKEHSRPPYSSDHGRQPYPDPNYGDRPSYPPYDQRPPYGDEGGGGPYADPYPESRIPHEEPFSRSRWPPQDDYYRKPPLDYEDKYSCGGPGPFQPKVHEYGHRPAAHLHGDSFSYKHDQMDISSNILSHNYSKSFHTSSFSSFTQSAVAVKDYNHGLSINRPPPNDSIPGLSTSYPPEGGLFPAAKSLEPPEYGERNFHSRRYNSPSPPCDDMDDRKTGGDYKEERTCTELFPSASGIKLEPVLIKDLLVSPGRHKRPKQIVFVLRGPPGSGKTYLARLIKDKEVENGGSAPRILSLDDYFMVESDRAQIDPETGKRLQNKDFEYEYEAEMEETYRASLYKCFKKTVEDRLFPIIILDAINDKVQHFEPFCAFAKSRGFQTYIIETDISDPLTCFKRNVHKRALEDIKKIILNWEETPSYLKKSDIRSLLQDDSIQEVEMEDTNNEEEEPKAAEDDEDEDEQDEGNLPHHLELSRWEKMENSDAKLDQLDGIHAGKRKHSSIEDYLQLPDDYEQRALEPGKKRVRWADIEERKKQEKRIKVGFVVGQTDWQQFTDPLHADKALTHTKYF